jgi:hypothetical protein
MTFGPGGDAGDLELGGWTAHATAAGIRLTGERGEIGFTLTSPRPGGAELRIGLVDPVAPDAVRVRVNGTEVAVRGSGAGAAGTRLTAAVPADVLAAYGGGRVVVAVERAADVAPRLLTMELADVAGLPAGEGDG